jgi:hypothetical protein
MMACFNTLGLALAPGLGLELALVLPLGTWLRLVLTLVPKMKQPHIKICPYPFFSNRIMFWGTSKK